MSSFAKLAAILTSSVLLPVSLLAGAPGALAQQRCEGTLCDLYYGKSSSFDDPPKHAAAPTPVTVPRGTILGMFDGSNARQAAAAAGAPAPSAPGKSLVGVGGGGIAALARGEKVEQCSGTLCDLYYGKSSSFEDQLPQPASAAAPTAQVAAEVVPEPAPVAVRGFDARPEPPRCASAGHDPWSCYR